MDIHLVKALEYLKPRFHFSLLAACLEGVRDALKTFNSGERMTLTGVGRTLRIKEEETTAKIADKALFEELLTGDQQASCADRGNDYPVW